MEATDITTESFLEFKDIGDITPIFLEPLLLLLNIWVSGISVDVTL